MDYFILLVIISRRITVVWGLFGLLVLPGDGLRQLIILIFALIYFLRINITTYILIQRKMNWNEIITISIWLLIIYLIFGMMGGGNIKPFGIMEFIGILLYLTGSYFNTVSEFQRHLWKKNPENMGKLYTGGLFRYAMHINYFGDTVLLTGFAMLTGNIWSFLIPCLMMIPIYRKNILINLNPMPKKPINLFLIYINFNYGN